MRFIKKAIAWFIMGCPVFAYVRMYSILNDHEEYAMLFLAYWMPAFFIVCFVGYALFAWAVEEIDK